MMSVSVSIIPPVKGAFLTFFLPARIRGLYFNVITVHTARHQKGVSCPNRSPKNGSEVWPPFRRSLFR